MKPRWITLVPSRAVITQIRPTEMLMLLILFAAPVHAQVGPKPPPTHKEVRYGPHERNVLDFWKAVSGKPAPFVVHIHSGGFADGSKDDLGVATLQGSVLEFFRARRSVANASPAETRKQESR